MNSWFPIYDWPTNAKHTILLLEGNNKEGMCDEETDWTIIIDNTT